MSPGPHVASPLGTREIGEYIYHYHRVSATGSQRVRWRLRNNWEGDDIMKEEMTKLVSRNLCREQILDFLSGGFPTSRSMLGAYVQSTEGFAISGFIMLTSLTSSSHTVSQVKEA